VTTLEYIAAIVIPAALKLLPAKMDSLEARAMLIAIGLQESRFLHRGQIGGPARGYWQFEQGGGVKGVLTHAASSPHARDILMTLGYNEAVQTSYAALENNDILACTYARLLLWTHPKALPQRWQTDYAWQQYLSTWRPGKPHRDTWDGFFDDAWAML
jgi:hypothetical protein